MIRTAIFIIVILSISVNAFSQQQTGPTTITLQGTQATPLPISGRNPQTGSVTAVQSPVPGTTTSVNTVNPSIQVQGPYVGSTAGTAVPFSGRLSLREAIERGLGYNLGPVGLNEILRQANGQSKVARSALLPNL